MKLKQTDGDNMANEETGYLNVELKKDIIFQLKIIAAKQRITLKKYVEMVLENEVDKNE